MERRTAEVTEWLDTCQMHPRIVADLARVQAAWNSTRFRAAIQKSGDVCYRVLGEPRCEPGKSSVISESLPSRNPKPKLYWL
jgi:hypothetical protein